MTKQYRLVALCLAILFSIPILSAQDADTTAITATSDLVFAGALDGKLLAIDARSGELLWSHDSLQEYESVNQVPARGGSYDAHGPMLADDLLIISSGYGTFGQKGGNALLVFQLEGESP